MRLADIRIGKRLTVGFTVIVILTLLLGLFALNRQANLAGRTTKMYNHPLAVSNAIRDVKINVIEAEGVIKKFFRADFVEGSHDRAEVRMDSLVENINTAFVVLHDRFLGDIAHIEKANKLFKQWGKEVNNFSRDCRIDLPSGMNNYVRDGEPLIKELNVSVNIISDFANGMSKKFYAEAEEEETDTKNLMLIILGSIIIIGVVTSFVIIRSISRPLNDISMVAVSMMEGNFNNEIDISRRDEFGELSASLKSLQEEIQAAAIRSAEETKRIQDEMAEALSEGLEKIADGDLTVTIEGNFEGAFGLLQQNINKLTMSLREVINQVIFTVKETVNMAGDLAVTADEMKNIAVDQSRSTEEISTASEEMTATISDNAKSATHATEVAQENGDIANNGSTVVTQTISKMNDIAGVVKNSAENIEKLGESSKEIGDIVLVINGIADQTNLLALNAAIEAARAGEQGRGFAVVADEVRKLAESTTDATKKIAVMINSIQAETASAVTAMEQGNTEVKNGIKLADEAGKSLITIMKSSQEVIDMVNQIAVASEEQSQTSQDITSNISTMSNVATESSQKVDEIAQSADNLTNLTYSLSSLIEKFKVEDDSNSTGLALTNGVSHAEEVGANYQLLNN